MLRCGTAQPQLVFYSVHFLSNPSLSSLVCNFLTNDCFELYLLSSILPHLFSFQFYFELIHIYQGGFCGDHARGEGERINFEFFFVKYQPEENKH